MHYIFLILILFFSCSNPASNDIEISNAWIREVPAESEVTALYFDIENQGDSEDFIVSVEAPFSEKAEIHSTVVDQNGNAKMVKLEEVKIDKGENVRFAPGGNHVMLFGLSEEMNAGEEYEITVNLKKEGKRTLKANVIGLKESMMNKMDH